MPRLSGQGDSLSLDEVLIHFCRDLLRSANYNTKMGASETAHLAQVSSLMMGKAVACQTDYDLLMPRPELEGQRCTVPGCFCKSSEGFKDWSWMARGGFSLLLVLILFTFGCGLELEMQQYFPVTWHLLRWSFFVLNAIK